MFRNAVTPEQWDQAMQAVRKPLGKLISRKVQTATYRTELPGAPAGEYVIIQFKTSFENKKTLVVGAFRGANAKGGIVISQVERIGHDIYVTTRKTSRHDVLPIGEVQMGVDYKTRPLRFGQLFFRSALEGQLWSGVGNASSEDGDLGFVGLTAGFGLVR